MNENPYLDERIEIEPTTSCIRCDGKLFAWDEYCQGCGLEFLDLMEAVNHLSSSIKSRLVALLEDTEE